jgi:hypothetical protein
MSHLTGPRLAFAGRFLSDVSTRNNLAANYAEPPAGEDLWNPVGGATFEPLGCALTGAWLDGALQGEDPAIGYVVSGADDRPGGKMVDLDPDWQMASELWGFALRIFDPATGELALAGAFTPASFRDLYTRQLVDGGAINQQPAGGRFVSTLTGITWGPAADRSAVMRALRAASADRLAICLHQFGYYYAEEQARYRTGALIGSIGPRLAGEAETAQVSRRLRPFAVQAGNPPSPTVLLGAVDIELGQDSLAADFGHALLIDDPDGTITDLGKLLQIGATRSLAIGLAPRPGAAPPLNDAQVTLFGEVPVMAAGWYATSGGIVVWPLSAAARQQAAGAPLRVYLRTEGGLFPLNDETREGLFVRADSFVRRLDPGDTTAVTFHARRFGLPAAGVRIALEPPRQVPRGPLRPDALHYPAEIVTDADGRAELPIAGGTPHRREGIDGMVFAIAYTPLLTTGEKDRAGVGLGGLDQVVVHQREPYAAPAVPDWTRDVLPIMREYAHLYPIMTRHLFDLADERAVRLHARHMLLAMERPISDPNYMPVTRDLSEAKRQMILAWLRSAVAATESQLAERRTAQAEGGPRAGPAPSPGPVDLAHDAKRIAARVASGLTGEA